MNDIIATDTRSNPAQEDLVAYFAGAIIPACSEQRMLAANDPRILQDIFDTADTASVNGFCRHVEMVADEIAGCPFADLNEAEKEALTRRLENSNAANVLVFVSLVVQCYYRDPRVLAALELEARPAYPKGYEVEKSDWAMLEPVKQRPPFYKVVDE